MSSSAILRVFPLATAATPNPARFTGGLEAARVTPEIARRLVAVRFDIAYTAYDRPDQRAEVERAIAALCDAGGWSTRRAQRKLGVYILCGHAGDSEVAIVERLRWVVGLGATPFPMFYRWPAERKDPEADRMKRRLRRWMRPACIFHTGATGAPGLPYANAKEACLRGGRGGP